MNKNLIKLLAVIIIAGQAQTTLSYDWSMFGQGTAHFFSRAYNNTIGSLSVNQQILSVATIVIGITGAVIINEKFKTLEQRVSNVEDKEACRKGKKKFHALITKNLEKTTAEAWLELSKKFNKTHPVYTMEVVETTEYKEKITTSNYSSLAVDLYKKQPEKTWVAGYFYSGTQSTWKKTEKK
ncbi:MAG: hypothetical protein WC707_02980 [Candidatus Babeliaceae bacterium]|jgi:hypothetical protein